MLFLAVKNLVQEKTRLLISVGGVAFSVLLIMSIQGLFQGWSNKTGEYVRTVPAHYWVTQTGAADMFHTPSVLPLTVRDFLTGVPGVASAKPFSGRRVAFAHNGKDINLYVIADDTENDVGAPARVVGGKAVPDKGEIIIDRVVGRSENIRIGDTIPVAGRTLKVSGDSEGGYILSFSFAFATKEDAESILQLPGATNFFLVTVKESTNAGGVASRIEADPAVDAITKDRFMENNTNIVPDTFLPIILVLLLIGIAVGMTVIGLIIFTSTIEKAREYGVLKAIGGQQPPALHCRAGDRRSRPRLPCRCGTGPGRQRRRGEPMSRSSSRRSAGSMPPGSSPSPWPWPWCPRCCRPAGWPVSIRRKCSGHERFQTFSQLSALTAEENVMMPLITAGIPRKEARAKARTALEQLELGHRLRNLPRDLSGGEKQRVAIAGSLANDPRLILADEPTANLDAKTGQDVTLLLCETACRENRAVIIVSHGQRLRTAAKRVITVEDGRLTAEDRGEHDRHCRMHTAGSPS